MKHARPFFFFAIMLLLTNVSAAQRIITAKLYSHLAISDGVSIPVFEEKNNKVIAFRWLAPAIKYQYDNNSYKELELTNLVLQRRPDIETETRFSIGLRYEYGKRLSKKENAPMIFSVGGSVRTFYALEQLNESNILGLVVENQFYGLSLAFTPHLEYRLTNHLVFDFSPYIELVNGTTRLEYVYDEFIDEEQRGSVDFYLKSFQSFFRFGVGWRF